MKPRIDYVSCFTYLFQYPDWLGRALLGSVMMLIPIVGPIIAQGWLVHLMHHRIRGDRSTLPPFDDFEGLLKTGVTPFLVGLVVSLPVVLLILLGTALVFATFFLGSGILSAVLYRVLGDAGGALGVLGGGLIALLLFAALMAGSFAIGALLQPLMLRAELTGDFGKAFDREPLLAQTRQMLRPFLIGSLVLMLGATVLMSAGSMVCFGFYPAMFLMLVAQSELRTQVYRAWLAEGNPPIAAASFLDGASLKDPALLSG